MKLYIHIHHQARLEWLEDTGVDLQLYYDTHEYLNDNATFIEKDIVKTTEHNYRMMWIAKYEIDPGDLTFLVMKWHDLIVTTTEDRVFVYTIQT